MASSNHAKTPIDLDALERHMAEIERYDGQDAAIQTTTVRALIQRLREAEADYEAAKARYAALVGTVMEYERRIAKLEGK